MQTYSVLYAADIPHYVTFEVQAANTEEALIAAKAKINTGDLLLQDPDWDLSILERIVRIEDENGNTIINDVPLDNYRLQTIAGNGHQPLIDALKAAEAAIEEATDVMFSGEDGKPVKRLKPADIEHAYLTLCGVIVQVHEAINAGESV